ncbi:hypothetical protein DFJ58DRAFT_845618 [Suillus subalutaceus]|uniref:uncharacterized protein n=1 Tax=Suillus subalutaceus TaxID=48586 RepID=UPI001B86FEC7|nr:uncharacterized protein DFJ58DRAFT_845618 [Suillus subalutaceus]KAG1839623.1 hypothetical protein DFJ58DRAFT_845618 [Suillus subalutaceus]
MATRTTKMSCVTIYRAPLSMISIIGRPPDAIFKIAGVPCSSTTGMRVKYQRRPAMSPVTIIFVQRGKTYPATVKGTISVGGTGDVGLIDNNKDGMGKMHPGTRKVKNSVDWLPSLQEFRLRTLKTEYIPVPIVEMVEYQCKMSRRCYKQEAICNPDYSIAGNRAPYKNASHTTPMVADTLIEMSITTSEGEEGRNAGNSSHAATPYYH